MPLCTFCQKKKKKKKTWSINARFISRRGYAHSWDASMYAKADCCTKTKMHTLSQTHRELETAWGAGREPTGGCGEDGGQSRWADSICSAGQAVPIFQLKPYTGPTLAHRPNFGQPWAWLPCVFYMSKQKSAFSVLLCLQFFFFFSSFVTLFGCACKFDCALMEGFILSVYLFICSQL